MKYVIDTSVDVKTYVQEQDSGKALRLRNEYHQGVKQFRQTVYDCLYIALAEREGCELVTADDKLVKAVQSTLPFVLPLLSLP